MKFDKDYRRFTTDTAELERRLADKRRRAIARRMEAEAAKKADLLRKMSEIPPDLKRWSRGYIQSVAKSVGIAQGGGREWMGLLADRFGIELIPEPEIGGQKHVALQLALDLEAISGVRSWRPKSYIPFGVRASQK